MKLTAKGRYAVMAVADLAAQGADSVVPLTDIAARQRISLSFLEQLFSKLRKAGLVESYRGVSGGYQLTTSPDIMTVDQIIFAVDEDIKAHGCTPEAKVACTGGSDHCITHNLWGALENHIESFLAGVTVADVLNQKFPAAASNELEAAE